jgi:6-phosphogluconolactonase (cycloisomerase 2 family)
MISSSHGAKGEFRVWQAWTFLATVALASGLLLVNGCGGGMKSASTASPTTSFAFIANSGSGNVSAFAVGANGVLSPLAGSPFQADAGAEFMAFDSVHQLLFVSNQNANDLSAFSVNRSTGDLTAVPGSPFPTGATPHGVAVDPAGRFVFVGNQGDHSVSVFTISATSGALTPIPGSPFKGIDSPFGMTVNPAGTVLYVNNFNANTVTALQIDSANGALSGTAASFATGQTPIGLIADPNGKFLYVGNHMGNSITAYGVNPSNGALTPVGSPPNSSGACSVSCHTNPLRLAIDPTDRFAYATDVGNNSVAAFSLNNGTLTPIASSAPTGQHPFGLALDPSGKFLFVVNKVDNTISAFGVNSTQGMFASVPGAPFPAGGSGPVGIVIVAKQ